MSRDPVVDQHRTTEQTGVGQTRLCPAGLHVLTREKVVVDDAVAGKWHCADCRRISARRALMQRQKKRRKKGARV